MKQPVRSCRQATPPSPARQRLSARSARSARCPPIVSQTNSPGEESHMFALWWLRQLQRRWFPDRAMRRVPIRRVRLGLEVLEERLTPSNYTGADASDTAGWAGVHYWCRLSRGERLRLE